MTLQTDTELSPTGKRILKTWQSQYVGEGPRPKHTHRRAGQVTVGAIYEAIAAGETFSVADVLFVLSLPATVGDGEGYYHSAIGANNLSFLESMERAIGRQPFFYRGSRLHLSQIITWEAEAVRVTSIRDREGYVVACSYHPRTQTVRHRYKITRASLAAAPRAPG